MSKSYQIEAIIQMSCTKTLPDVQRYFSRKSRSRRAAMFNHKIIFFSQLAEDCGVHPADVEIVVNNTKPARNLVFVPTTYYKEMDNGN